MNKLTIIGNLTRDPETRTVNGDKTVCTFTVAVNRRIRNGQNEADFFRVNAWGKMGESCQKWLVKGRKVGVVGRVSASAYEAQDGSARASLEVMAQDVEFLSGKSEEAQAQATGAPAAGTQSGYTDVTDDDDLPF